METSQATWATNGFLGVVTALLFTTGLALAGWVSVWAIYAWAGRDGSWILTYGSAALLGLALPVAFLRGYERWQTKHGLHAADADKGTKTLSWACGLFATLLFVLACPFIVLFAYLAWGSWGDGDHLASAYFAIVALGMLAEPIAFTVFYDRWQLRNGLQ